MTKQPDDDLAVRLTVGDARTAQRAGVKFARVLAGAHGADFMLALCEQTDLIRRAILDAGFSAEQAQLATGHFEVAAREEWTRLNYRVVPQSARALAPQSARA